jgi:SpoVK/Ycf46/Vps4 family AAA+-type ATPase
MFHGIPGCGKTSTIKAIANEGKRHIINIQLSQIKSKEQLNHLFFNDEINVMDNGKTERFIIPVTERMYVIEDIDAMGDTVLKREWKKPETKKEIKMDDLGNIIEDEPNPIDLSFLLNLLDGTLESEGRILAITTNFPERIDKALIRPGRIDMIVNFKKCSNEILKQIVENFYDIEVEYPTLDDKNLDKKWTPAEVNQILFRNFKDHSKALKELVELTPEELCGIPN